MNGPSRFTKNAWGLGVGATSTRWTARAANASYLRGLKFRHLPPRKNDVEPCLAARTPIIWSPIVATPRIPGNRIAPENGPHLAGRTSPVGPGGPPLKFFFQKPRGVFGIPGLNVVIRQLLRSTSGSGSGSPTCRLCVAPRVAVLGARRYTSIDDQSGGSGCIDKDTLARRNPVTIPCGNLNDLQAHFGMAMRWVSGQPRTYLKNRSMKPAPNGKRHTPPNAG